jgi:hypothetical protein
LLESTTNSQLDIKLAEFATVLDYGQIQNYSKQPNAEVDKLAKERETHTPRLLRVATHNNPKPNHQQKNWKKPKRKRQHKRVEIATKYLEP